MWYKSALSEGNYTLEDIRDFFKETDSAFTIYVVEQRFVVGRGADYFREFKGKVNYIDTNEIIKKRTSGILSKITKRIPNLTELVEICFGKRNPMTILEIISTLSKLFSVNEHQAAGPDVIDPIIIQEGEILPKYINQIVALHKTSILRPVIIILLKDNDFNRAIQLLSGCPHNTQVKMIRNSGETENYKVINCGASNIDEFLNAFSYQCFSTCSQTKRNILYNEEWADNSQTKLYGPSIMQIRTNLLFRDKTLVRVDLDNLIKDIILKESDNDYDYDQKLLQAFECILRIFRVFCNDGGKEDMNRAWEIASSLNNEILLAHVYRNAYFFDNFSFAEKIQMMELASDIFSRNGMEDHSIYCKNNSLVRQFDTENVSVYDFLALQEQAIHNVPGLVGMSHILNNVGAALLTNGYPDEAIEYFDKGIDYAFRPERSIQKIAILSNKAIAKTYCYNHVEDYELKKIMNLIFDNKEVLNLPFLSARYALNIVAVGYSENIELGNQLLNSYPVQKLIQHSLEDNILGSGQLLLQLEVLARKYNQPHLANLCNKPTKILEAKGCRKDFIIKNSFNPCSFSTWF